MSEPVQPHPKNVPGPFYVEFGCCTACDVPMQEAPGMFAYDETNHCYVCRQPQTETECTDILSATAFAELACIRYRGRDPDTLRRLAEMDLRHLCDIQPPPEITPVIRNHVTFADADTTRIFSAQQLADDFKCYLTQTKNQYWELKWKPIQISSDLVEIDFSWN